MLIENQKFKNEEVIKSHCVNEDMEEKLLNKDHQSQNFNQRDKLEKEKAIENSTERRVTRLMKKFISAEELSGNTINA